MSTRVPSTECNWCHYTRSDQVAYVCPNCHLAYVPLSGLRPYVQNFADHLARDIEDARQQRGLTWPDLVDVLRGLADHYSGEARYWPTVPRKSEGGSSVQ
jgi:hypothetical protein